MFSSKEIRSVEFEEVKRGYNMTDVKAFLRKIADQISEMEGERDALLAEKEGFDAEKAALEQKLVVLADSVEQYRKEEDSLRNALLSAQKLGDSIVKEANENAEIILADAQKKADGILNGIDGQIATEQNTLERLQGEVSKFKNDVLSIYKSHLEVLSMIPEVEADENEAPKKEIEAAVDAVASGSGSTIEIDKVSVEVPAEEAAKPEEAVAEPTENAEEKPAIPGSDNAFFAPAQPEAEDDPFTTFQPLPQIDPHTPEQVEDETKAEDVADVGSGENADKEQTSRFGQLDFGDGFSFNTK